MTEHVQKVRVRYRRCEFFILCRFTLHLNIARKEGISRSRSGGWWGATKCKRCANQRVFHIISLTAVLRMVAAVAYKLLPFSLPAVSPHINVAIEYIPEPSTVVERYLRRVNNDRLMARESIVDVTISKNVCYFKKTNRFKKNIGLSLTVIAGWY